jgi:hypothetical protein
MGPGCQPLQLTQCVQMPSTAPAAASCMPATKVQLYYLQHLQPINARLAMALQCHKLWNGVGAVGPVHALQKCATALHCQKLINVYRTGCETQVGKTTGSPEPGLSVHVCGCGRELGMSTGPLVQRALACCGMKCLATWYCHRAL